MLSGCAGNVSPQLTSVFPDAAPAVRSVSAQTGSPQMAGSGEIIWQAERIENSAAEVLSFEMKGKSDRVKIVQQGSLDSWNWAPEQSGVYQVRVISTGENGHRSKGSWSKPFEITPPLKINNFSADRPAPQMAGASSINWSVAASGGVGEHSITFELERDSNATVVHSGTAATWTWLPDSAGNYRVRVIVKDALGNRVKSSWSDLYEITPPLVVDTPRPGKSAPQAALTKPIDWMIDATGGAPP